MLFSVLIANYNNSQYLGQAINSVLRQTWWDWEIVIVDDRSTDGFEEIVTAFLHDNRIRYYENDRNRGCGYTKKRCIELAQGSVLGFLDADDALRPDALSILAAAHEEFPETSLIHSTHFICNKKLEVSRIADYPRAIPAETEYLFLNDGRVHHFAVFKKGFYYKTCGLNESLQKAVDQDLYYKLEETGPILFIDLPLYYYRIHDNSISTAGKEASATLWHYEVIIDACQRRIQALSRLKSAGSAKRRPYEVKMLKTKILRSYRRGAWLPLLFNAMVYPFAGGWVHIIQYARKWAGEGKSLLKRSFVYDHQIQP